VVVKDGGLERAISSNNKNSTFLENSTGFEKRFVLPVEFALLFLKRVFLIIFAILSG